MNTTRILAVVRINGKVVARVSPDALQDVSECPIHPLHRDTCWACRIAAEVAEMNKNKPAHT